MRTLISLMLSLILLCPPSLAEPASEAPLTVNARAAVLIERTSGRVLYAENEREILPIASTTKVMTALLAIENSELTDIVTASENASGVEGTSIYLGVGEQLSMLNMLHGLMLRSGNDAAVAIAEHIDGTVENFSARMNARAQEIGAEAHFVTPNGLDKGGNGTSALGLARISAVALRYPAFREIVMKRTATIPWPGHDYDRVLENKNRLLRELPGCTGVKTGFTKKAGRCLVFSCERGGMELVGVVLNCGTWFETAKAMTEWGFANYRPKRLIDKRSVAGQAKVEQGRDRTVDALYAEPLTLPVRGEEKVEVTVQLNQPLYAPVKEGQVVGHALVNVDGFTECTVDLVAANDVDEARSFWDRVWRAVRGWFGW